LKNSISSDIETHAPSSARQVVRVNMAAKYHNQDRVILDVRSPGEFLQGHIPGAKNLPLFSDEERALVGTAYKQESPQKAMELGLGIAGAKMNQYVETAHLLAPDKKVLVHCWRGGKRSESMGWLLNLCGMDVQVLNGGYKAFRQWGRSFRERHTLKLIVIGAQTGSGKTKVLQALKKRGEQIIDLESLANHKGSAFGSLGEQEQPSAEHFENLLMQAYYTINPEKRVFIENESKKIGCCPLPDDFFTQMHQGFFMYYQIPESARIQYLIDDYAQFGVEPLKARFEKIKTKLGGDLYKKALSALDNHDFAEAARAALHFYDKTYQFGFERIDPSRKTQLILNHANIEEIADQLIFTANQFNIS
jgi:tRNA 2-selenouridine synthase